MMLPWHPFFYRWTTAHLASRNCPQLSCSLSDIRTAEIMVANWGLFQFRIGDFSPQSNCKTYLCVIWRETVFGSVTLYQNPQPPENLRRAKVQELNWGGCPEMDSPRFLQILSKRLPQHYPEQNRY